MIIPITADAPRLPNNLITSLLALVWREKNPLGAPEARFEYPAEDRPSCLEPRLLVPLARSLSIAEKADIGSVNRGQPTAR
jgi:hypothetical protein